MEEYDQTPALGGPVGDEELPLRQALVEGFLVFLHHGVCAVDKGSCGRWSGEARSAETRPVSSHTAQRQQRKTAGLRKPSGCGERSNRLC